ncbi:MAG: 30S ribosomal protein S14 [Angustibacter sp.]
MAKKSKIAANDKRRELVARYAERRRSLKELIRLSPPGSAAQIQAIALLNAMPKNSTAVRVRNRDQVDGRPRGYIRKVGLSRIRFRTMAHAGELPGITKSSW